jgi:hypothetical protein
MFEPVNTDVLDSNSTRKIITFSLAAPIVVILLAGYVPSVSDFYEHHHWLQHLLDLVAALLTLVLAFVEVRHSGEANRYRKDANEYREKANELSKQKVQLERKRLKLQVRVNFLQEEIERKLTKVRLFARVHRESTDIKLYVSNLSNFDLWLNQVQLIITQINGVTIPQPKEHTLGGARGLPKSESAKDYLLLGTLMKENNNQSTGLDMTFEVRVSVTGVKDKMETIFSPIYRYSHGELIVISYR